jgi:hypothetical protein
LLLEREQADGVLSGGHLDWQLNVAVARGVEEELSGLLLGLKNESSVFEANHNKLLALLNALFILERNRAVTIDSLLLSNNLRSLMRAYTSRNVAFITENHLFCKDFRVLHENLTFFLTCKVVETILVEHSELGPLTAVDKSLALAPGNRTEITVLT